jgi:hypothetical protein
MTIERARLAGGVEVPAFMYGTAWKEERPLVLGTSLASRSLFEAQAQVSWSTRPHCSVPRPTR